MIEAPAWYHCMLSFDRAAGIFAPEVFRNMQKHLVKAGITGWAQVNDFRGNTDLQERIRYDLYYIENWSIWFDLRIIALTVIHIFRSRHAG